MARIARYFSNEASIDLADLAISLELSREFTGSEIGRSTRLERESLLPRFLQLLIKITRFCSTPRFFDDDLTACNRAADLRPS